jgi:hypothetical protein
MKKEQKKQTVLSHNAFLLVVTMVAVTSVTVVEALVPSTSTHTVKNPLESSSRLNALMTPTEDNMDLLPSLPAMSAEIREQKGVHHKNNYERRERRRRRKQNEMNNNNNDAPTRNNSSEREYRNKKSSTPSKRDDDSSDATNELLSSIPKLSDILEGRAAFNNECEEKNTGKVKTQNKQEIKIINAKPKTKREVPAPTRSVNNDVPTTESTKNMEPSDKNNNSNGRDDNAVKTKQQTASPVVASSVKTTPKQQTSSPAVNSTTKTKQETASPAGNSPMKTSQKPPAQGLLPWRANYRSSKRTQGRIQKAFTQSSPSARGSHLRAQGVLDALLETPPEYCNAVNLVCALTYSAKAMGRQRMDHMDKNLDFRKSLQETFDILHDLLVVHRDEGLFTPRQLCNVAWAIAKHFDRDPELLSKAVAKDSPEGRLEETIDEIARQLTTILFDEDNDVNDVSDVVDADSVTKSKPIKSSFQQPKIKLGEICMACWAYGKLRHREIPPGWPGPPQMGAVKTQKAIVTDWKTEQLGTRRRVGSNFGNHENNGGSDGKKVLSETDKLFDAIGYALCQSVDGEWQNDIENDGPQSIILEDCSWSELANVGWAFAAHGRCRSTESETLLKALSQEAAYRLKHGTIANNSNYQHFLVRDVTQLLWSLGTLQCDNFRLADDLVLLIESLTTNLRLGEKTKSRFAQGRPLRRWSCADLVQTSVALAHARIDENLLLRAVYEEGNYRLMEGASSSRKPASLTTLPSEQKMSDNNLDLGEDRRMFHAWEASILLWAQARLFLTEQEGVEFDEFAEDAPLFFLKALRESRGSFAGAMIGPQEQANIVWSLVILEKYDSPGAIILIDLIFGEAARSCKENKSMQLEHAHQLWQAYFMLEEDCPEAVKRVPMWFVTYLKEQWSLEKARLKISSARHQSLSATLQLMGVDHINEHDEDIDVAIILQPNAVWIHETDMDEDEISESEIDGEDHVSVAVEFDGPNHFTRVRADSQEPGAPRPPPPRTLGHTVLKYRLLKKQGWTVVRVPYYEFDKIPFWASMERQRYLQRKLKTHANIQFSEVDVSEYKTLTPDRESRFD